MQHSTGNELLGEHAYPKEESGLVLTEDQASGLSSAPALCYMRSECATGRILHHNAQVIRRQDGLVHIDEVDVAWAQLCLALDFAEGAVSQVSWNGPGKEFDCHETVPLAIHEQPSVCCRSSSQVLDRPVAGL